MTFLKDPSAINENIHKILAVLLTPMKFGFIKTKYNGKKHEALANFIDENMPVSIAYPILVFFCNLSGNLMQGITAFLKAETTPKINQTQAQLQTITNSMDGLLSLIPSAKETAPNGNFIST